ncbi:AbrB/MazE/SpoVT family DNA-binding domain-containing protein [Paenibacillus polymyxa]|uniref:AbrB/MazE/SpoVT family DNA-binding domain-containing protein n=1 Tax=Paenibacillus polymyxa TaxID=1406 RepID=UPI0025B6FE97|nr:AbrB/MazE/SpoVT family DNA-binding domain-containing protein [Paenibacillus polymyxa]MDN4106158.1 AbrB/MazE/SpoVT family DNA-binding domain-containing protein [Paenibacillus polymyxa]
MKNTGMVRPLDLLGRIVFPKEIRFSLNIDAGEKIEFFIDVETKLMIVQKYCGVSCKMCNSPYELSYFKGSLLCKTCMFDLKENIGVSKIPIAKEMKNIEKRAYKTSDQMLEQLRELIRKYPNAKLRDYAKCLEVSNGRISQLKKLL